MTSKELDEALARLWRRFLREREYEQELARIDAARKQGGSDE